MAICLKPNGEVMSVPPTASALLPLLIGNVYHIRGEVKKGVKSERGWQAATQRSQLMMLSRARVGISKFRL